MTVIFETSSTGQLLNAAVGLNRPLVCCGTGTSHMTGLQGFAATLQDALMEFHNAYLTYDFRKILTSVADPTVLNPRGDNYATAGAGSSHMVGAQLTQFNADITAGRRYDIMFTDCGLYNDNPTTQADLDTCMTRFLTFAAAFFSPTGNNGMAIVIQGTFGQNVSLHQSWAAMCRRQEVLSGGRIRFYDAASVLIDPANTSTSGWTWIGGGPGNALTSVTGDGTHVTQNGSRLLAPLLADVLRDLCPRTYPIGGSYANFLYDAVNFRWADLLGTGAGMLGTDGYDQNTAGFSGNVVGNGGQSGLNNTWALQWNSAGTVTPTITTTSAGRREQTITLGGSATAGGITFDYKLINSNVNNSVATREYIGGIEVELIGVTGAGQPTMYIVNGSYSGPDVTFLPVGTSQPNDSYPDATSKTLKLRFMRSIALTGANPTMGLFIPIRTKNPLAGVIKIRKAFLQLVKE